MTKDLEPQTYSDLAFQDAYQYIEGVLDGSVVTGELVRLAVERHVNDLKYAEEKGIYFDVSAVDRVYRFFSLLKHWKGSLAGQQYVVSPWEAFILLSVFGWKRVSDNTRKFRSCYIQLARKNSKTTFMGGIGLYLTTADQEEGAEVYTAATKRDQARICHRDAKEMRLKSPIIKSKTKGFKDNIVYEARSSKFEPLGANSDSLDGLNPHGAIMDELHKHRTRDLWDVIEYGMGAREQPLLLGITTAGDDLQSMCFEMREHAEQILKVEDYPSHFVFVAELDKDDDPDDPANWIKGNPNLGRSVKLDKLKEDFEKARQMPSLKANFQRYRLNKWVAGGADKWMDINLWNACPSVQLALDGRDCYGGLDLSATQDITALVLYFEPSGDDELHHALPFFWIPEENLAEREKHYRVPLRAWVEQGWIATTPGNVVDYDYIEQRIVQLRSMYNLLSIAYDDWNSTGIVSNLIEREIDMVSMPQNTKTFNSPMTETADLIKAKKINNSGNPVLKWMLSNTHAWCDAQERAKPVKLQGKKRYKIDGVVAMLMAKALADSEESENNGTIYDEREMYSV